MQSDLLGGEDKVDVKGEAVARDAVEDESQVPHVHRLRAALGVPQVEREGATDEPVERSAGEATPERLAADLDGPR